LPADDNNPTEALEQAQIRRKIHEALATLPLEQRDALALAYFKGYTHRQIAETLDQPLGTIKTRIRGGLFSASSTGYATVKIYAKELLTNFRSFEVTVEPTGGSPKPGNYVVLVSRH